VIEAAVGFMFQWTVDGLLEEEVLPHVLCTN